MSGVLKAIASYIPSGWTAEWYFTDEFRYVVIACPSNITNTWGYFVTVDLEDRCFRSGMSASGPKAGPKGNRLRGHGWRKRLVEQAVRHLQAAL